MINEEDEKTVREAIDEAAELMEDERCGSKSEREDIELERLRRHAALNRIIGYEYE